METKTCPTCEVVFNPSTANQKYCCHKCTRSIKANCEYCQKAVVRYKRADNIYFCSRKCSDIHHKRSVIIRCKHCSKDFMVKSSRIEYGYGKYCSKECHNKSMLKIVYSSCKSCGKVFDVPKNNHTGQYCSKKCSDEGYRKPIDKNTLTKLYVEEELTSREVGEIVGRDKKVVLDYLNYYGLPIRADGIKNKERIKCKDGHMVRSYYERAFDNYMHKEGIEHEYDVRLPFNKRCMADFKVGDVYVEIWGMMSWKKYREGRKKKLMLYEENGAILLEVFPEDFKQLENKINELKRLIT